MAQAPGIRGISSEMLSSDPKGAMEDLLQLLNPLISSVSTGMNKGLNIKENLNVVEKDIIIKVPDTQWTSPTLLHSWVNYDSGTNSLAGFRIDDDGVVHLKGTVKDGSAIPTVIFVLPEGYRPPTIMHFPVTSNNAFGSVSIDASGNVQADAGSTTWLSLDNISFSALNGTGSPAYTGANWPLLVDSGQPSPILHVELGLVKDQQSNTNISHGGAGVHWEPGPGGKIVLRRISRLTPNKSYKVKLLLYPT